MPSSSTLTKKRRPISGAALHPRPYTGKDTQFVLCAQLRGPLARGISERNTLDENGEIQGGKIRIAAAAARHLDVATGEEAVVRRIWSILTGETKLCGLRNADALLTACNSSLHLEGIHVFPASLKSAREMAATSLELAGKDNPEDAEELAQELYAIAHTVKDGLTAYVSPRALWILGGEESEWLQPRT